MFKTEGLVRTITVDKQIHYAERYIHIAVARLRLYVPLYTHLYYTSRPRLFDRIRYTRWFFVLVYNHVKTLFSFFQNPVGFFKNKFTTTGFIYVCRKTHTRIYYNYFFRINVQH